MSGRPGVASSCHVKEQLKKHSQRRCATYAALHSSRRALTHVRHDEEGGRHHARQPVILQQQLLQVLQVLCDKKVVKYPDIHQRMARFGLLRSAPTTDAMLSSGRDTCAGAQRVCTS